MGAEKVETQFRKDVAAANLSDEVEAVFWRAEGKAQQIHHPIVGVEHLIFGMTGGDTKVAQVLSEANVTFTAVANGIFTKFGLGGFQEPSAQEMSPELKETIDLFSFDLSPELTPTNLLRILIGENETTASQFLAGLGVDVAALWRALERPEQADEGDAPKTDRDHADNGEASNAAPDQADSVETVEYHSDPHAPVQPKALEQDRSGMFGDGGMFR